MRPLPPVYEGRIEQLYRQLFRKPVTSARIANQSRLLNLELEAIAREIAEGEMSKRKVQKEVKVTPVHRKEVADGLNRLIRKKMGEMLKIPSSRLDERLRERIIMENRQSFHVLSRVLFMIRDPRLIPSITHIISYGPEQLHDDAVDAMLRFRPTDIKDTSFVIRLLGSQNPNKVKRGLRFVKRWADNRQLELERRLQAGENRNLDSPNPSHKFISPVAALIGHARYDEFRKEHVDTLKAMRHAGFSDLARELHEHEKGRERPNGR